MMNLSVKGRNVLCQKRDKYLLRKINILKPNNFDICQVIELCMLLLATFFGRDLALEVEYIILEKKNNICEKVTVYCSILPVGRSALLSFPDKFKFETAS